MLRAALFALCFIAMPALAAGNPADSLGGLGGNSSQPFNIDAEQSLEYHQDSKTYVAHGNAKVTRGTFTVTGDTLTAYERPQAGNPDSNEIYRFTAEGHVTVSNGRATAYGDHADYAIDNQVAVMTGKNLKMISDSDILTARDRFEYDAANKKATAFGGAKAIRHTPQGTRTITADKMIAYFRDDAGGSLVADHIDAEGHVKMVSGNAPGTPPDVASGDRGNYSIGDNKATLHGDVKLTRGPNQIEGNAAEVDMQSGASRMLSENETTETPGRVRGLLLPSSKDAAQQKKQN